MPGTVRAEMPADSFWHAYAMFVSEVAQLTFGTVDAQAAAQPSAKTRCRTNHSANSRFRSRSSR
jgi:hypothetical protein